MKKILLSIVSLLTITTFAQQKSVLFIGNSYTTVNDLPQLTKDLALSLGDTLIIDSNTPGGTTFNGHINNTTTMSKIAQGTWDYVILQAQSQEPSFPPAQVTVDTYPFAEQLVNAVRNANDCTIPMFYMTWGRQNGDQTNCANYTPLCTYEGMQARLRESYLEMGDDNNAEVSPVGAAWKYARDNYPGFTMYSIDGSHPSIYGSYLAACVHYTAMYKKSPVGASFITNLPAGDAAILQQIAKDVVLDSLDTWGIGRADVVAGFATNESSLTLNTVNQSVNATDLFWYWGDGTTNSSQGDTTHNYTTSGSYTVSLVADNGCTSDSITASVSLSNVGVTEFENLEALFFANNELNIVFKTSEKRTITILDISGKTISNKETYTVNYQEHIDASKAMYIVRISERDKIYSRKINVR